jgi:hypothetical protein
MKREPYIFIMPRCSKNATSVHSVLTSFVKYTPYTLMEAHLLIAYMHNKYVLFLAFVPDVRQ